MTPEIHLKGWLERDGKVLARAEVERMLSQEPELLSRCGGEFALAWDACRARDRFGIMLSPEPAGTIVCNGQAVGAIDPTPPACDLEEAIVTAVRLRSDEGIVALSGGVDSSLVAALAGLECVVVGVEESHDAARAAHVARDLGLVLHTVTPTEAEIEEALARVVRVIPDPTNPVDAAIATTLSFVAAWAGEHGYTRILAGQGADELFGGYARYLESENLAADLERDFAGLAHQGVRDQRVAALHGAYFSLPYMDVRVVRAIRGVPAAEKVRDGVRKYPLREIAARHIPADTAWYEKKAMQYGSGIWRVIQRLTRKNGYKKSVQGYLNHISRAEYGIGD
ncbi:asparagine synthase [Methanoculleus sp. FWC-SCC1]|uniref:Asparagine synthase n=1 Tax=Methanoculleus frigidifontis TaxID=2584085 RepID=A0ABT8MCW3_9EURY|nr:asparagine synthase C-terminal domain-containing protein [Methanoculleus sp. FWC-SCC1]MDN7025726.1 asparagine synthase [Methanoculleus sp. FWC-SCC1]